MIIRSKGKHLSLLGSSIVAIMGVIILFSGTGVNAAVGAAATMPPAGSSPAVKAEQQQHLQNIISKGNEEISRRINNLTAVQSKISATVKLTTNDQNILSTEVGSEISGLMTLKTQLDSESTLSAAVTDARAIFTEYRVYALVLPKIELVSAADNQQITESKLTKFAQLLQSRLTAAQSSGKNVTALQSDLDNMTSKINSAQAISGSIESNVINLQPSDYDSNHSVLSGDAAQLKMARNDEQTAYDDAKLIVQGHQSL